jgi:thiamine-triphosphatase
MGPRAVNTLKLEVERKFSSLAVYPLTTNGGRPPFHNLKPLGDRTLHDIYYDRSRLLSSSGIWVRQRDGHWQAKIKRGGNYNNSRFEETSNINDIAKHVREVTGFAQSDSAFFGLSPTATITTYRESWRADDKFKIVLDRTDFGHVVGEVELEEEVDIEDRCHMNKIMTGMDLEIARFMRRYAWAFTSGTPTGKLSAYFVRNSP